MYILLISAQNWVVKESKPVCWFWERIPPFCVTAAAPLSIIPNRGSPQVVTVPLPADAGKAADTIPRHRGYLPHKYLVEAHIYPSIHPSTQNTYIHCKGGGPRGRISFSWVWNSSTFPPQYLRTHFWVHIFNKTNAMWSKYKEKGDDVIPGHQLHFWNSYVYLLNSINRKIFCLKRQLIILW